ncbi:MAG: hypothetical protein ABEH35_07630 [Haloarculaceae archaeon]
MSLNIGPALKSGIDQLISRTGAVLLLAYVALYAVYQSAFNGLLLVAYQRMGLPTEEAALPMPLDAPLPVLGAIVLATLLVMTYWSVVAVRTFVAEQRQRIPREFLTHRPVFAVGNLLVGGIVLTILLAVGFVLLVVPGVYMMVAFLFMTVFIAVEDDNFVTALKRSWSLTDGNRLDLFLLLLVVMALGFVVGFGFSLAQMAVVFVGASEALLLAANVVLIAPMSLFNLAVVAAAYNQLREDEAGDGPAAGTSAPDAPSPV